MCSSIQLNLILYDQFNSVQYNSTQYNLINACSLSIAFHSLRIDLLIIAHATTYILTPILSHRQQHLSYHFYHHPLH